MVAVLVLTSSRLALVVVVEVQGKQCRMRNSDRIMRLGTETRAAAGAVASLAVVQKQLQRLPGEEHHRVRVKLNRGRGAVLPQIGSP